MNKLMDKEFLADPPENVYGVASKERVQKVFSGVRSQIRALENEHQHSVLELNVSRAEVSGHEPTSRLANRRVLLDALDRD